MKQILLISLFLHTSGGSWLEKAHYPTIDLINVRLAPWPINLQRVIYYTDTCYALQFRDQGAMNAVTIKTMEIYNLDQLKYLEMGLATLEKGSNGDVAEFKDYSIKKVGTKKENYWYILSFDGAVTNFQQPEANRMIKIINNLVSSQN
ncbi:MAG TPA: hypothetical protein VII44_04595 [Puia sp.]